MELTPGVIVAWLVAGLAAGWGAGKVSRGHDFGLIADLAVGLIGSLLGGLAAEVFTARGLELTASILIAFGTAVVLLVLVRVVGGRRQAV